MLKVRYSFSIPKQNLKAVKLGFLTVNLLWVNLPEANRTITSINSTKTIKTLMLSPFHYKVAKKNIVKEFYKFNVLFTVTKNLKINKTLLVFNHPTFLHIYFIFIGLIRIQFHNHVNYNVKFWSVLKFILRYTSVKHKYSGNLQIPYLLP